MVTADARISEDSFVYCMIWREWSQRISRVKSRRQNKTIEFLKNLAMDGSPLGLNDLPGQIFSAAPLQPPTRSTALGAWFLTV